MDWTHMLLGLDKMTQKISSSYYMSIRTMEVINKHITLKNYVSGSLKESDFEISTEQIAFRIDPETNDIFVKNLYLSIDPFLRGRMQPRKDSYVPSFTPGQVITGFGIAKVMLSNHPGFHKNDLVVGFIGWEEYSIIKIADSLRKVPLLDVPLSYFLGILGMPGLTAYVGFYKICHPKMGENVFVSAASGAVGQLVGQFAQLSGCYVVGSVGTKAKANLLTSKFGYNDAIIYKNEEDLEQALRRCLPNGIDVYFDNVGGEILAATLSNINNYGRIVCCGTISQYDSATPYGIKNLSQLIVKRVRMEGFIVSDYNKYYPEFTEYVYGLINMKKIVYVEDIIEGLENAPSSLIGLLCGQNTGKRIIKISEAKNE